MSAVREPLGDRPAREGTAALDHLGEALMGGAIAMGVAAVAMTLLATAPAFRPGGRSSPVAAARDRLIGPLVTLTGGALVAFIAYLGYAGRCGDACIDRGGPELAGRSVWWRIDEAWQWSGQLALAGVGLAAAALALVLAARGMRGVRVAVIVALVSFATWTVAALALPLGFELFSQ